jgi:hypothetical protein
MTKESRQIPSLSQPATYEIKVPGHLDKSWSEWIEGMTITVESEDASPITILTCTVDQAALQGLLRRIYAMGVPLISVKCIAHDTRK